MGDFSVRAVLSAVDKNFASTMKSALGYTNNLKDTLTSGIGFGAMMAIGQSAVQAVMGEMSSLSKETIETSDSMYKLQAAMRFSGYEEKEIQRIAGATGTLKTYADKTVFSLQDVMSTFGALSANGIKDADKLTEAVGNAVAVFGGGAQEYSSVALAFSQAMASGALHAQDWNQILNASPQLAGGLRKELIKLNPKIGKDFKKAMEDGTLTADLLAEAMNNIGMTEMAKEAATSVTTFEGAMGNLEATVVSGMMNLYDSFAKSSVIDAINGMNEKIGSGFNWLAVKVPAAIDKISPYWAVFKTDFIEVKNAFGDAASAIVGHVGELTDSFGSAESVSSFSDVLGVATDALKSFAGFCEEHSEVIAKVLTTLPKLYVAYKGFKIVKAVAPFVGTFSKGILMLAGKGVGAIAGKLLGIGAAEKAVGESSVTSANQMMQSAVAFLALGAGVALISAGFALLSYSSIQLASAGPAAIATMVGMVAAVGALMYVAKSVAPTLTAGAVGFVAFGAAVLVAGAGMALMTSAAINLANAGPLAIGVMVGMVAAVALLAAGAAVLGPALTAGTVGFIAFGAAILMVGAGAALASAALYVVAAAIPAITEYGLQGAVAIAVLGTGMTIFAAGAALAGVACVVLGAGMLIAATGVALLGAATLVLSAGVLVLATGMLVASAAIALLTAQLPAIALYGTQAAISIVALGASLIALSAGAVTAGAACIALSAGLLLAGAGMATLAFAAIALGAGICLIASGIMLASAGVTMLSDSLAIISENGKSGAGSLAILSGALIAFTPVATVSGIACTLLGAGLLAVGAGVILVGTGMMILATSTLIGCAALTMMSNILPIIVENGTRGAEAIATLGVGLAVFAAGATVAGISALILAAGLAAFSVGLTAVTIGVIGFSVGMVALSASIALASVSLLAASAGIAVFNAALKAIIPNGQQGAAALIALSYGAIAFGIGAATAGTGCITLGAGLAVATAGVLAFSAGIIVTSAGMLALSASLKLVNSSMKSISENAKTAQKSLSSMKSSMSIVNEGLDAIGNKAKSSMNSMISAFDGASSKAKSSGGKVGSAFNSGLGTGMTSAIGTAKSSTNTIISVFNSTGNRAYSCGVYIGQGLANGMRSQLGAVQSVAAQLAIAAEAAIRAKAKINSPSKVAEGLGGYWGGGYVGGILSKVKEAWRASEKLVSVPSKVMKRQKLAVAGGYGNMELSDDYTYYQEAKYTIIVPVELEGREIAKASATYTQDELEKEDKLKNMLKGIKDV